MPDRPASELELQRRWAESRWPTPFLQSASGAPIRVIWPGRWNRGPGPDFRGAQILDNEGRARRGDVELHLEAAAWLRHGHADDPAYRELLLHIVESAAQPRRTSSPRAARIPAAIPLPAPIDDTDTADAEIAPPCAGIAARAGASAVESRLLQIAERRFLRKAAELRALEIPPGPGDGDDRRVLIAAARALGQPHNAAISERAAQQALPAARDWGNVRLSIEAEGWRRGRGALGTPDGLSLVLTTLLRRWATGNSSPWTAFERLAALPRREAIGELRIARCLGPTRATQLLADAIYPLTGSWEQWSWLAGARYQRTEELRQRIDSARGAGFVWRHPQTQALLELERTRCRQWACRVCPLAALDRSLSPRRGQGMAR